MFFRSKRAVAAAAALFLCGCSTPDLVTGSLDSGFGEAVKFNAAVQTINPDPVYNSSATQPGYEGERNAEAVERYRKGQVKQLEEIGTTSTGSSSGGGS